VLVEGGGNMMIGMSLGGRWGEEVAHGDNEEEKVV
jgi:hypothetical protein